MSARIRPVCDDIETVDQPYQKGIPDGKAIKVLQPETGNWHHCHKNTRSRYRALQAKTVPAVR